MRMEAISGRNQSYQNELVSYQLTDVGRGRGLCEYFECVTDWVHVHLRYLVHATVFIYKTSHPQSRKYKYDVTLLPSNTHWPRISYHRPPVKVHVNVAE
jgi:hypothetical protein